MINSHELLSPQEEGKVFQEYLYQQILFFAVQSGLPEDSKGKELYLTKAKKTIESYRNVQLSAPDKLIQLFFSLKNLPAGLYPQVTESLIKPIIDRLRATAEVEFDHTSGKLLVAGFPVAELEAQHVSALELLLQQEPGKLVSVKELAGLGSNGEHTLKTLAVVLKKINLTAGIAGVEPVQPLKLLGQAIERKNEDGKPYKSWGFTLQSSFQHLKYLTAE